MSRRALFGLALPIRLPVAHPKLSSWNAFWCGTGAEFCLVCVFPFAWSIKFAKLTGASLFPPSWRTPRLFRCKANTERTTYVFWKWINKQILRKIFTSKSNSTRESSVISKRRGFDVAAEKPLESWRDSQGLDKSTFPWTQLAKVQSSWLTTRDSREASETQSQKWKLYRLCQTFECNRSF